MNALVLLAVLAVLLLLQCIVIKHFAFKRLSYQRSFSAPSAYEGDEVKMTEIILNRKILPVPFLTAESRISPFLAFHRAEDISISGEWYHKSVFYLRPFSRLTRTHSVSLLKRGFYRAGSVALTATDLAGMISVGEMLETGAAIEVFPRVLSGDSIPLPASRWQGDLIVKRWIAPDPIWVGGIRAYAPRDEPSFIHWPASARAGSLQVKVHDPTADIKMLVVINAQLTEAQWADLMPYEHQTVEDMIAIAAGLITQSLNQGMEAGYAINIPLDKGDDLTIFPPARHPGRETELLRAMAHLTLEKTRPFTFLLDALTAFTGVDMLLLSVYDSEQIQMKIRQLTLRGNTAKLHLMPLVRQAYEGGAAD